MAVSEKVEIKRGASLGERTRAERVSLKSTNFALRSHPPGIALFYASNTFPGDRCSTNLGVSLTNLDYVPVRVGKSIPFRNALDPFQLSDSRSLVIVFDLIAFHQFARLVNTRR